MIVHGSKALQQVRRLAVMGLILPLPLVAFSIYVFDHYLKNWYRDPFVLGILVVFLVGQISAVRENMLLVKGARKCAALLQWLRNTAAQPNADWEKGLANQADGHLRDVIHNAYRTAKQAGGTSVQSILDTAANRRSSRDARTIGLQVAVNRTTLKLGFLGTLIGLLLTFTPMKDAILALRDSGGEMKFVTDIAKAIDGDYYAIYTTLLATGLSLLIEMITLQLLERALGRFENMNSFVEDWILVEFEPAIRKISLQSESGLHDGQAALDVSIAKLGEAVALTTMRIEQVLKIQEALGKRVDRLLEYDRDSMLVIAERLGDGKKA